MKAKKPKRIVLAMEELEKILALAATSPLDEESIKMLRAMGETFVWLTAELEKKRVDIRGLKKILFGTNNTEKTSEVLGKEDKDNQTDSQPGDAEEDKAKDKEKSDKKGEKPKPKGHGRTGAAAYTGALRIKVPNGEFRRGDPCLKCGLGKLYPLSRLRTVVCMTGCAPIHATVYEFEDLRCNFCSEIFPAKMPDYVPKKKYDEESAAIIGLLKYSTGMPFTRLEWLQKNLGIPLAASTQWEIVEKAARALAPVHQELIRQAAQGDLFFNDDTGVKILEYLKENAQIEAAQADAKEKTKSRTGMFTTGIVAIREGHQIVLIFSGRKHAGENIADVLKERASQLEPPLQMCDGSSRNAPADIETLLCNCLTHGRRKFVEIADCFPAECRFVLLVLREIYINDAFTRDQKMSDQERLSYHQAHSAGHMNDLKRWMAKQIKEKKVEPNSALGQAISYMQKRWGKLTRFLHVPGAPLDNNLCERILKMAIRHRKNSLFFKTQNGADVADIFMSLIYTAVLAGVNPLDYLTVLLKNAKHPPRAPHLLMPWNYQETAAAIKVKVTTAATETARS